MRNFSIKIFFHQKIEISKKSFVIQVKCINLCSIFTVLMIVFVKIYIYCVTHLQIEIQK